jgi:hypothetical protein
MSVLGNSQLLMTPEGYQISRSVRLRSSASAYFNRTLTTPTNNKIYNWSGWVKRGKLGSEQGIFATGTSAGTSCGLVFSSSDTLVFFTDNGSTSYLATTQVFRDPSAWYHIFAAVDTTQATSSNRVKLYVNGVQITAFGSATYMSQNATSLFNTAAAHFIGAESTGSTSLYLDGYLTEINFIDGQALTPSSFGETDSITGVWKPKKYAGTYGTNGFYLNFSDPSAATAAAIGKDYSGNGNNWTPNNISVTSGVTYDSMLDVPTMWADGGNGRGNYAVLNPLGADSPSSTTANGNLTLLNSASNQKRATIPVVLSDTNKYYWEVTVNGTATGNFPNMGMYVVGAGTNWVGYDGNSIGLYQGGGLYYNGSLVATLTSFANGDVISIAYDPVTGKIWFAKNGTWMASGVPSTGTSPNYTLPTGVDRVAGGYTGSGYGTLEFNFGQRPFSYTPPTGFKALNTQNLPDATIKKGNAYFDVVARAGATAPTSVTSLAFQPDLLWTKTRSAVTNHNLFDSARGLSVRLQSDNTGADAAAGSMVTSFNSNGYTFGSDYSGTNLSGSTHVDWVWKESASAGFDIVTYTGDGTNGRTVSHALGVVPKMVIVKSRSIVANWIVKHASLSSTNTLELNSTAAQGLAGSGYIGDLSSSTTFTLVNGGSAITNVNGNGSTYVAYLFAEVAGYSKFGSYTGNGSTDGPFVYCGFRPKFVMFKRTDSLGSWLIQDSSRDAYNVNNANLYANISNAEDTGRPVDFVSNGFKIRYSAGDPNVSSGTYIFMALAENPFKNSLAR